MLPVALTALAFTGCGQGGNTVASTTTAPEPGHITSSMFPHGTWPLTVRAGTVSCEGTSVIFTTRGGTRYAVNGTALQNRSLRPIRGIWRASREIPGTKIDLSPVLDAGLKLCR